MRDDRRFPTGSTSAYPSTWPDGETATRNGMPMRSSWLKRPRHRASVMRVSSNVTVLFMT
ncbi:hypothetical protein A3Q38_00395 [Clavibacter nebraskensis]|nr:hypothetical protein A3Q38_00395 [Clavibacter nebraskensis]